MTPGEPGQGSLIAERLLRVIDEGHRTATYKLALLLALIDACAEQATTSGSAPDEVHTRAVAEHVVRLYYPQVRPYVAERGTGIDAEEPLRQITLKNSVTLAAVYRFHLDCGRLPSVDAARRADPTAWEGCLDVVEVNFAQYPLRRFQVLGGSEIRFLYDVDWTESVGLRQLHSPDGGRVRFRPGAADELLRLTPLIRPLVELHWVREVARLNGLDTEGERLRAHLFGAVRAAMPGALRSRLSELQDHRCFYCEGPAGTAPQVDHFLPWSRWPNDAVENLVVSDARCNGDKRDHMASAELVDRWAQRFTHGRGELSSVADDLGWVSAPQRSLNLLRAGYAHVPTGTPLWAGRRRLLVEELEPIRARLAAIDARRRASG